MFACFLWCPSERGLVIIIVAVTGILSDTAAVGSAPSISDWLDVLL